MSKQDRLLLDAAGAAINRAAVSQEILSNHSGVFLAVGYIPFELDTAAELCDSSMENGQFSMQKFSTTGIDGINPLLAFTCLPNMPAHHVAMNFGILGSYYIAYPDCMQFYLALREAVCRLVEGEIGCALVGGVADQNNFLVEHHYSKAHPSVANLVADCGAFIILETKSSAQKRKAKVLMELESCEIQYKEKLNLQVNSPESKVKLGPAGLILHLASFLEKGGDKFHHLIENRDVVASSNWQKPL